MNFKTTILLPAVASLFCIMAGQAFAAPSEGFGYNGAGNSEESQSVQADSDNVTGVVKDESGAPLVGVMVYIKGTSTGVSTDPDGSYSIKAPAEGKSYTLVFNYIGTVPQEIVVSRQRKLDIVLVNDNELAEAMIVGAYGTKQSREDLIGSAFQVNADALKDKPKTRIDNLLEGLVPGMNITPNADYAGTTRTRYQTRVRGGASLSATNEPLWVIDGSPVFTGDETNQVKGMSYTVSPLSYLDPNDIESITVLKDADQVTIYGANGSNGVILVTTKSGKYNTPLSVSATVEFGVSALDRSTLFKTMNASQYIEVAREAWTNSGYSMDNFPYQDNEWNSYSTTSTDWINEYYGIGSTIYANLSLRSGTDKMATYVSGSYYREGNIIKGDNQQRFTFSAKNIIKFTPWLKFNTALTASLNDNNLFTLGREYLETIPISTPYMPDGSYRLFNQIYSDGNWVMQKFWDNVVPAREENDNIQKTLLTSADFSLDADIIKGLKAVAQYSIDYQHSHEDIYDSKLTLDGMELTTNEPTGYSTRGDASYINWTAIGRLNFDRTFGRHKVGAVAGIELRQERIKLLHAYGRGFMNDNIKELEYADDDSIDAYSNTYIDRSMSYFVRGTYSYDSRYYFSANYRREGDSEFGEYVQWGDFWSVGASWNIHNEKFFKSDKISMLKLKVSYGTSGNAKVNASNAAGTYSYGSSYSYGGVTGAVVSTVPNPGLSWEKTRMFNTGIRMEFLKGRIAAEVEYYNNYTKDLISRIYVSRTVSTERIYANVGELSNSGVEFNISSLNIKSGDFRWNTSFNISHNKNLIRKLYNGISTSYGTYLWTEGHDRHTYYLVEWAGVDPADGMPMWYDLNGNLTKSYSSTNRKPGKSSSPILAGGMVNDLSWRNWTLSFQINYVIGGYALADYTRYFSDGYNITDGNQAVEIYYYRWRTPGQLTSFPKVSFTSTQSTMNSTRFLYNKTSFELSTVSLSYSLPESVLKRLKISGGDISLVCNNVYLLTPDQKRGFNSYKTMKYGYPRTRTFSLSFNVSF